MEYTQYLALLEELLSTLTTLNEVEAAKVDAVRAHDLAALNETMKQDQTLSLTLRGLEQRRHTMVQQLGVAGVALSDLPKHCPVEYQDQTQTLVEAILRQRTILQSAQNTSRALMQRDIHYIKEELGRRGMDPELQEEYQSTLGARPSNLSTDFRA